MQKFLAFLLMLTAMFYSFFYGYDDNKVIDTLTPGVEQTLITSDKLEVSVEDEVQVSSSTMNIKIVNHTKKFYKFNGEPDIEVLTKDGWYDVAKTAFFLAGEINGTIGGEETLTLTVKGINTFNIKKGYTYRIVMQFDDTFGDIVYAEARFKVSK